MKNKNFLVYFIVTTIFCFTLFIIKYIDDTKNDYQEISEKILFQQASTLFNNIVNIRKWNSDHGGIYVKTHDELKPNPYLQDNHTYTKNGDLLIKINPSWMTRQISDISNKNENYYFKISSTNPLNPINYPDKFEEQALKSLQNTKNEFYTSLEEDRYNFVGSIIVEPSCLSCHNTQNYKVGDIIGGLRISIPIEHYKKNIEIIDSKTNLLYFVTFFTSTVFILIITFAINSIYARELNIMKLNKTLEKKVNQRTKELRNANKQLLEISTTDYLTNLSNRRYFFDIGKKAFHLAKREKNALSIICIDVDLFKQINDNYGHNIGDEVLKLVANKMIINTRKSDIVARTGGEEFTILLNNTDKNNALILSEKLRTNIENSSFKNDDVEVKVTISLGISQIKDDDLALDSIISRADKALYIAKNEGRNKSIIYL